jgi:Na+/proline symporter/nitrogen-specific signal transduction histidine kinase
MGTTVVILISFSYLLLLFGIAYYSELLAKRRKGIWQNGYVYALSISIYCTAWTYYGSVGRASKDGLLFLPIYLGPLLVMPFWWLIMRKITRICKSQGITTMADFISARYGKRVSLGIVVTIFCVIGLIPYIALQIKAIAQSYHLIVYNVFTLPAKTSATWFDEVFYITLGLGLFTILFGTQSIDASERHQGLVVAISIEAIVKLVAFLVVGFYVVSVISNDLPTPTLPKPDFSKSYYTSEWFFVSVASGLAFMFLPRQFQVAVIENTHESHLKKVVWFFPVYLLLINIFVLPIALVGNSLFSTKDITADMYVLLLPIFYGQDLIGLLVYIGGFSAATSMLIVEIMALSVMVSNHLVMPLLLKIFKNHPRHASLGVWVLHTRRVCIIALLLLAFLYFKFFTFKSSLVSIGLISFVAIAQFAPAILFGIFWKKGTYWGAMLGILAGFMVWFCTLLLPNLIETGILPAPWITQEFQIWLSMQGFEPVSYAFLWSMFANIWIYVLVSLTSTPSQKEVEQAHIFVHIFQIATTPQEPNTWRKVYKPDVQNLLFSVLGEVKGRQVLFNFEAEYAKNEGINTEQNHHFVLYVENTLAKYIGSASAHILVESISHREAITSSQVLEIVLESQEVRELNEQLAEQKAELEALTDQLKYTDKLKNEFISTVTHELRTPLTAIRAFSEILADNPDLEEDQRNEFLGTIIAETQRMERLINQVLELEKYESGKQTLSFLPTNINLLVGEVARNLKILAREEGKTIFLELTPDLPTPNIDKDRITQVLINLIGNALKFTQKEIGEIYLRTFLQNKKILIEVQDNGSGVVPALHTLIFEKFYQVEDQNIRKPKGSGLGLAICKQIIHYHGGEIWVESQPEKNYTKFSFTLCI